MGRQGYPSEMFDYLFSFIANDYPLLLNIGAGTGLGHKDMVEHGADVIACDRSHEMLAIAKKKFRHLNIHFEQAHAESLPFNNLTFNVVTALSSFHWFEYPRGYQEIYRVLQRNGFLFIACKESRGTFHEECREIIKEYIPGNTPPIDTVFEPKLKTIGFRDFRKHQIKAIDTYTVQEAVAHIQSVSLWNLVPDEEKRRALDRVRNLCDSLAKEDILERPIAIKTLIAWK